MGASNNIVHTGVIQTVGPSHLQVRITQQASACSSCLAKAHCNAADSRERCIDIHTDNASDYAVGETVRMTVGTSRGLEAVWWGFGLPLILTVAAVSIATLCSASEGVAALAALVTLASYGGWLYRHRKYMEQRFAFTVEKLS